MYCFLYFRAISSKFQTTSTPETITLDLSIDSPHIIADTSPQPFYLLANELSQSSNNASCIQVTIIATIE